jgi:ketosteroid isomerase-like protein
MKKIIKSGLSLAFVTLLLAAPVLGQDMAKVMKEMTATYEKAYNSEDAKTLVAMYTEDGVRTFDDGRNYKGSAELLAGFMAEFEANDLKVKISMGEITPAGMDKATSTGTYEVKGTLGTGEKVSYMGKYTNSLVKVNGVWKIAKTAGETIQ